MRELNPRAWIPSLNRYATGFDDLYYHRQMNREGEWWCYPAGEDEPLDVEIELPTGLKDKNGREIYEGDIISNDFHTFKITWSEHFTAFEARNENEGYESNVWFEAKYGEVIGNIHENKELLEIKDEPSGY